MHYVRLDFNLAGHNNPGNLLRRGSISVNIGIIVHMFVPHVIKGKAYISWT